MHLARKKLELETVGLNGRKDGQDRVDRPEIDREDIGQLAHLGKQVDARRPSRVVGHGTRFLGARTRAVPDSVRAGTSRRHHAQGGCRTATTG